MVTMVEGSGDDNSDFGKNEGEKGKLWETWKRYQPHWNSKEQSSRWWWWWWCLTLIVVSTNQKIDNWELYSQNNFLPINTYFQKYSLENWLMSFSLKNDKNMRANLLFWPKNVTVSKLWLDFKIWRCYEAKIFEHKEARFEVSCFEHILSFHFLLLFPWNLKDGFMFSFEKFVYPKYTSTHHPPKQPK